MSKVRSSTAPFALIYGHVVRITKSLAIMNMRIIAGVLALAALCLVPVSGSTPIMPLSEVKPGMVGIGRTVFQSTELQDFKVQIIGVLKNIQGPKRDLILARLEGDPVTETGVAAGMSGSPVYINGRLIGAVGYSIGSFPKVRHRTTALCLKFT